MKLVWRFQKSNAEDIVGSYMTEKRSSHTRTAEKYLLTLSQQHFSQH